MAWRDKYKIMLSGTYAAMPSSGDTDQWYRVTDGTTNLGKLYKGTGTGWDEVAGNPYVAPHDLDSDTHTGELPISRVSGHTAFGPTAHQQAFAASVLRRPA